MQMSRKVCRQRMQTPYPSLGTGPSIAMAARTSVLTQQAQSPQHPMRLQPVSDTGREQLKSVWICPHCPDITAVGTPLNNLIQSLLPYTNCQRSHCHGSDEDLTSLSETKYALPFCSAFKCKAKGATTGEMCCQLLKGVASCQLHCCLTCHKHEQNNTTQQTSPT